ncbi:MAG TPA: signal peptidase I [Candidatus Methylomirabilis sp.]|nr:signal peptidase I [Candidatus Methylomirabilis sp.]HSC71705.1 signal peptidase I [Candidatus Methylomirabilis sp.]
MTAQKTAEEEREAEPKRTAPAQRSKSVFREYAEALIIAVLLALVIRTFVVQAFKIPSGSMLPTLQIGDHILVNKFLYYFSPIKRGDIIVFKFPQDESRDFIKRVIGLPGETLETKGRQVLINGTPLSEPYAVFADGPLSRGLEREHVGPLVIPPDHLFVMGDNRDRSMDSRVWGLLDVHKVKGRAFIVYFSIRSEDIPYASPIPGVFYVAAHPSLIRWNRFGTLIR